MTADVHLVKPLAALYREGGHALLIGDVHGAEGPAVDFQRLAVLLGGVAAAFVEGVGLDDRRIRQAGGEKLLHPGAGQEVRPFGLAGVQLNGDLALQHGGDAVIEFLEPLFGEVTREEDDGALARALFKGDVAVAANTGDGIFHAHVYRSFLGSTG